MPDTPRVDDYVDRLLATAAPLSPSQRERLTRLLNGRPRAYADDRRELDFREEQAQRRRRAAAARRLPPLDDGRRDPLSEAI